MGRAVHSPGAPGEAGHLPRGRGGSEPGEHPGLRCAGVLCKAGGGFEAERVLRWMQYERSIYSLANEKEKSSRSKEVTKRKCLDTWKIMLNTTFDISNL